MAKVSLPSARIPDGKLSPSLGVKVNNRIAAALAWLNRGASILPCQPGSKKLVSGYGPYRNQITNPDDLYSWFGDSTKYNLAICVPISILAIDFDNEQLFWNWEAGLSNEYLTYEEISPNGWHVFYYVPGGVPEGIKTIPGIELKKVIMVSPSELEGFIYRPVAPEAELVKVHDVFSLLSPLLSDDPIVRTDVLSKREQAGDDLVSRIKAAVPVVSLASRFTELKRSGGGGRWLAGCCPLPGHDDHNPSFWVDTVRGLWGCHACGKRGDVINLYALIHQVSLYQAISDLAGEVDRQR